MQFMLLAYDGTDDDAPARRLAVREQHLALGDKLVDEGKMLYGTAILDEKGAMIGSMLIVEYDSRAELDQWLRIEPYITGDVWRDIQIRPVRVGPSFTGLRRV
ncbi:YciI family protein [Nocardia vaccinii]|uniref:YciI family protein n=1 Tax=Nocardia vaccinii TaxID=1822 RepID=UPI00082A3842|nr:YciI family protein [Nocardia vaccinii]